MLKRRFNIMTRYFLAVLLVLPLGSCNSWLDVYPEEQQSMDNFWTTKEEVEQVLMGAYTKLRGCCLQMVKWGELRGDMLKVANSTTSAEAKVADMTQLTINNSLCSWEDIYNAISRANSVIEYSASAMEKDITFSQGLSDSYVAEAVFIRSLCYFYLLRTFGEVPLILKPYVDDSQSFYVPKSDKNTIANQLIADLKTWAEKCKPGYEVAWQNKGRATKWACYTLLADICLWQGDYQGAINACNQVITKGPASLVSNEAWYTLYYPGNSVESIFEMQWDDDLSQTNSFYSLFFNGTNTSTFVVSDAARELFEEGVTEIDIRGIGGTYIKDGDYSGKVWKFGGTGIYGADGELRTERQRDNNWIFYRYADVLLIKAEALVMQRNYEGARDLVTEIRTRAGHTIELPLPETERDALLMVIDERAREFLAEGKRWFDILRVAHIKNFSVYQDYLKEVLLAPVAAKDRLTWEAKLADTNSYYLPILKTEITKSNGVILQNPFYADQD